MGVIINIDEALKLRTDYNILREPLNDMIKNEQEAWERENPIDMLFKRNSIAKFQETYTSSIGFDHAMSETSDYAVSPIFNTAEGFSATYRTRTFQGSFIISQQVLEDGEMGRVRDDASRFVKRWHGDIVEYCMTAISSGFGKPVEYVSGDGKSKIQLYSADTTDGDILTQTKNPLFSKNHTTIKRGDNPVIKQSNIFYVKDGDKVGIDLAGSDMGKIAKLADVINQVITYMENMKDDNGKRAGVIGPKTIVAGNDAHLKAALKTALSMEQFNDMGQFIGLNPAYQRAEVKYTPYLLDIPQCADGKGFFIVDSAYNASNHGLELTERVAFTLDVQETHRPLPRGIIYDGRQRFDVNVATWRGIAYVYIGSGSDTDTDFDAKATLDTNFTAITPSATIVKPVSIVGEVQTKSTPSE